MKKSSFSPFSMLVSVLLMVIFGVAIAYATFLENDYGTNTAKILVYNSRWLEIVLFFLCANMIGSVFRYKLISRKKWSILLFHLAFIFMIIGAGITRYFSYEGSMHIREGEASNQVVSSETYVSINVESGTETVERNKKVMFSPYTANKFSESIKIGDKKIKFENLGFIPSATESMVEDELGVPMLALLVLDGMERNDIILELKEQREVGSSLFSFESESELPSSVCFKRINNELYFTSPDSVKIIGMMGMGGKIIPAGEEHRLHEKTVYQLGSCRFVFRNYYPQASKQLIYVSEHQKMLRPDAFTLLIKSGSEECKINVFGNKGEVGKSATCLIDGMKVTATYGSVVYQLPFSLYLKDFQLERYPGSRSPSSFASEVELHDSKLESVMPFRIYMNNILKYKGYRFFQTFYDQDEKGTILTASYDWWGTAVSYFGYLLMVLGMLATLFNKNSRFITIIKQSRKLKELRNKLAAVLVLLLALLLAKPGYSVDAKEKLNKGHVKAFNELLVQDFQGRIEPVNTLASELLRKLSRTNRFEGLSATEVFLLMNVYPDHWKNKAIIKISNSELRKQLGIPGKYATFTQLASSEGRSTSMLHQLLANVYKIKPVERNKFDKEIINVDERINICYKIFKGEFLKVFPIPGDNNNTWLNNQEFVNVMDSIADVENVLSLNTYYNLVAEAIKSGEWSQANQKLEQIKGYQREFGKAVIPSNGKVKFEIFYNEQNIFGVLAKICAFAGLLLLVVYFTNVFKPINILEKILKYSILVALILFVIYSGGITIRWYISGHAPWSNGYETMIFIGWATLLCGLLFYKRSDLLAPVTIVLSGLILFVAGMSWMNPEVTNLVPVLKSYWLIIHVAVITSSYGFLGVAALLGIINLVLLVSRTEKNFKKITLSTLEIAYNIELALIIGLVLLTIGTFIGAVWANESWGRYWGWDPKETWALITVLVYAIILHFRKVPGLKGEMVLSAGAVIGIFSVLMTFFGVNYYLSGMHSYAQGDPPPIPLALYLVVVLCISLIVSASISERKYKSQKKEFLNEKYIDS